MLESASQSTKFNDYLLERGWAGWQVGGTPPPLEPCQPEPRPLLPQERYLLPLPLAACTARPRSAPDHLWLQSWVRGSSELQDQSLHPKSPHLQLWVVMQVPLPYIWRFAPVPPHMPGSMCPDGCAGQLHGVKQAALQPTQQRVFLQALSLEKSKCLYPLACDPPCESGNQQLFPINSTATGPALPLVSLERGGIRSTNSRTLLHWHSEWSPEGLSVPFQQLLNLLRLLQHFVCCLAQFQIHISVFTNRYSKANKTPVELVSHLFSS